MRVAGIAALRYPDKSNEIPSGEDPSKDGAPFFCLLEDDRLVKKLAVHVDRLLVPDVDPKDVYLTIRVATKGLELAQYPL